MELTEQEQQKLQENEEILELGEHRPWQIFRRTRIEAAIQRINDELLSQRMPNWDKYLSLWNRKQALHSVLNELDSIARETDALKAKAAKKPDNSPATGELA